MDISKIIKDSIDEYNRIRHDNIVSCVGCVFAKNLNLDCESMRDCDECYIKSFTKLIENNICDEELKNEAELMRKIAKEHCLDAIDDFSAKCRNNIEKAAYTGHFSCTVFYSSDTNRYVIDVVKKKLENDGYVVTTPYDDDAVISDVPGDPISLKISWD